ncbi:MAG TPA: 16S rRNA (guanine(966)-N(2))-methyltransferase RsmD [Dehalococcoidia bacterium]|nr:16S rRNA (guanine(966)-N(2))-methyltransferase RsmD [Dehalococcoidia bacterium]
MPIRVIAGEARGRRLKASPGRGTRPTSDRLREALFAILEAHGADFTRVLDLYAGTGALGIEALSRGAGSCDFVEADASACEVIRENLRLTGYSERGRVICATVARAAARLQGPYTLVVADPPYEYDRAESELADLIERGLLLPGGIVAVEHAKRREWPERLAGLKKLLTRRHGDSAVSLYQ